VNLKTGEEYLITQNSVFFFLKSLFTKNNNLSNSTYLNKMFGVRKAIKQYIYKEQKNEYIRKR
jgi:hypothetical protein